MFPRIRVAIGMVLAMFLIASATASAKGGFDFLTITGPDLKEALQVSDTSLTQGFFTFANFYEDQTREPADPGKGYEVTRHYVQGQSDVIFDRLHYYPETGFVFYDGIENGDSEYDGKWYTASPDVKPIFESALGVQSKSAPLPEKQEPVSSVLEPAVQPKAVEFNPPVSLVLGIVLTAGLAGLFAVAFWRRKSFTQS